eukprot:CAMPEP_0171071166 /NCGR_PEP_ID=MMETSP0766_2-20121228/10169_1 /TAXON_ID=439317 /ORGANISM="Gambierdiscus australes, Strain CAWD 149" /LENGTH=47 /DNA_ID= /DNA_START= /DNA_END= /DNA_ORIENTATION=
MKVAWPEAPHHGLMPVGPCTCQARSGRLSGNAPAPILMLSPQTRAPQ